MTPPVYWGDGEKPSPESLFGEKSSGETPQISPMEKTPHPVLQPVEKSPHTFWGHVEKSPRHYGILLHFSLNCRVLINGHFCILLVNC